MITAAAFFQLQQKSVAIWTDDGAQPFLSAYAKDDVDEIEARTSARSTEELSKPK